MAYSWGGFSGEIWKALGWGGVGNPDSGDQMPGPLTIGTESGKSVNDQRAMKISTVFACTRIITQTISCLPLLVYSRDGDSRQRDNDHYLNRLLRQSPNAAMTALAFRQALTAQRVLWGNGYALIQRSTAGEPIALLPVLPEYMEIKRSGDEVEYHYRNNQGVRVLAQDSVLHVKGFGTDGVMGFSTLAHAREVMGVSASADQFAAKAFGSNGRPTGVLMMDQTLNPEQRTNAKKLYEGLSVDDSKLWLLEAGTKYQALSLPPDDLQMLESRAFQISEIARFFGVPSHLINDTAKSTSWGSGIEQLTLGFLQYTIEPYLKEWESAIHDRLLTTTAARTTFVEHNVEGLLRADSAGRAAYLSTMVQNGLMTRNEGRAKDNLPPMVGGDDLTVQLNLTPVDELPKVNENVE
jgi:HK97 family phage portal protein